MSSSSSYLVVLLLLQVSVSNSYQVDRIQVGICKLVIGVTRAYSLYHPWTKYWSVSTTASSELTTVLFQFQARVRARARTSTGAHSCNIGDEIQPRGRGSLCHGDACYSSRLSIEQWASRIYLMVRKSAGTGRFSGQVVLPSRKATIRPAESWDWCETARSTKGYDRLTAGVKPESELEDG